MLLAFGLLVLFAASAMDATAQSPFPNKFPPRKAFQHPIPHSLANLPRLKSNITLQHRVSEDHGNVSVLHDDGTLIIPANSFDMQNTSLVFTPQGSGYTVQSVTPTYVSPGNNAQLAQLGGGSAKIQLPFTFKFYGTSYTSLFLNSNGNLTFATVDNFDYYTGLNTLAGGPPRIAPFFDYMVDAYGGGAGQIGLETFSDHINFYWIQVEDSNLAFNTFEMILQNNGVIQFNYGPSNATALSAGLSPGNTSSIQQVDFTQQKTPLSFTGAIGEAFSPVADLDLGAVSQAFYQLHPDNYDGLIAFADVDGLDGAYAQPVRNQTQGVSGIFDEGAFFGSKSRLFITANMGSISQYPADPTATIVASHTTLTMVGQMFGHAWMSYVDTNPPLLQGLSYLWSFVMDAQGSVMEGNLLQDLGNGQFKTTNATYHYSPLDEYLMGLRAPANVPNWFVVLNPTLVSAPSDFNCVPFGPACYAEAGVQFSGTRQNVSLQNVISNVGARVPSSSTAQKNFNVAFILVTPQGQAANAQSVTQLDTIRQQWSPWFVTATDNLGGMSTTLQANPPTISAVSPNQGLPVGGFLVTITGTNFQATSTVTIGGNTASVVSASATSLQVVAPNAGSNSGSVTLKVTNPDGQSASSSFTYNVSTQTQLQLTLPASGSVHTETAGTASTVQVGYGAISPATGVAVIRSFSNGSLVSEAAVPPTPAATQWTMYGEVGSGGVSTGVAIANPGTSPATLTLTLSNGNQTTLQLGAGAQHAAFINELFSNLSSFLGTLTVQSTVPVSIVALRGTQNANGQFIISTIPLSSGSSGTGGFAAFPIITDGGGYNTDIILVNSGTTTSSGMVTFSFNVQTDQGTNTQFPYTIPAGGMFRIRTAGASGTIVSGFASMSTNANSPTPNATAIIRLSSGSNLISETAVPAQTQISQAMMFGSLEANLRTGLALLNGQSQDVLVTLTPLDGSGQPVGNNITTVTVPAFQNKSKFLDELIPTLPVGYEGSVLVRSSAPIFAISLRGTTTLNGLFLMSTTPVLDLTQNYSGTFYFPQVVDGGGFTTEFLMMNAGSANVQVQFFDTTGKPMSVAFR
jgi:hypothetical protein